MQRKTMGEDQEYDATTSCKKHFHIKIFVKVK